jgi:predicted nucleic acid-binding protein
VAKPIAVTDTSPIIALASVGHLRLLDDLFEELVVPFEVWDELRDKADAIEPDLLTNLKSHRFHPPAPIPLAAATLDAGERAAIAVAASLPTAWVLLDELAARSVAQRLNLTVCGTLGILVESKRRGLVAAVAPLVQQMLASGFRMAPWLVEGVLGSVDEL